MTTLSPQCMAHLYRIVLGGELQNWTEGFAFIVSQSDKMHPTETQAFDNAKEALAMIGQMIRESNLYDLAIAGAYEALNVAPGETDRNVVQVAYTNIRRMGDLGERDARHAFYREILDCHHKTNDLWFAGTGFTAH